MTYTYKKSYVTKVSKDILRLLSMTMLSGSVYYLLDIEDSEFDLFLKDLKDKIGDKEIYMSENFISPTTHKFTIILHS